MQGDLIGGGIGWGVATAVGGIAAGWDFITSTGEGIYEGVSDWINNDDVFNQPEEFWADSTNEFKGPIPKTKKSSPSRAGETYAETLERIMRNEAKTGVTSPLGPDDPNQWEAVGTLPDNEDPQAPLKPGFVDSPVPMPPGGLEQNIVKRWVSKSGNLNPESYSGYKLKPTFRGNKSSGSSAATSEVTFSAVPVLDGDTIKWKARAQVLKGSSVKATFNWDAGFFPPNAADFGLIFDLGSMGGEFDMLAPINSPFGFYEDIPLTQTVAPPQVDPRRNEIPGPVPLPLPNPGRDTDWQPIPQPQPQPDPDRPLTPVIAPPTIVRDAPVAPGKIAPKPDRVTPTEVNNPLEVPSIDLGGLPQQVAKAIKTLNANTHMVGKLAVGAQTMRTSLANVAKEVGRIEAKNAAMLPTIAALADLLPLLIGGLPGGDGGKAPAKTITMNSFCNKDEEGNLESMSIIYPEMAMLEGILERLEDIPAFLEQHLAWKTPTCNERPQLQGDFRTLHFISDETSPYSNTRVSKRFRYRSVSGIGLGELVDHWRDFVWSAGPVCVQHAGASWGTPQVWAATADEGKRVIRHAAGEALIDADQDGRWIVGGSTSPRYGVPGTMRIDTRDGFYRITARDGSDSRPIVAKTRLDL